MICYKIIFDLILDHENSIQKTVNIQESVIAVNKGNGKFEIQILPKEVQFSCVNTILTMDVNNDGILDLILGGNQYEFKPQFSRLDSNYASVLLGNKNHTFSWSPYSKSGFFMKGEVKHLNTIKNKNKMITQNSATRTLVGKRISRTASLAATQVSPTSIAAGEVVVTDAAGKILDSTTVLTAKEIVVVQGQGSTKPLIKSDVIKLGKLISYKGKKAAAAVEQVSFIGYNGTSGSIDAITSNLYFARIAMLNEQNTFGNRTMYENFKYETGTSTSQKAVAQGLWLDAINLRNAEQMYKFERISDGTQADWTGTATHMYFTKGSSTVAFTTTGGVASTGTIAVGDVIRAATGGVYIVTSGGTGVASFTIDGKFQGATVELAGGATAASQAGVVATPVNWGIRITAVAKTYIVGIFRYYKVRFGLQLKDFGATTLTEPGTSPAVGASEGQGTTEQIQDLEWMSQGVDGKIYRTDPMLPVTNVANAVSNLGSDVGFAQLILKFYDNDPLPIGETAKSPKMLVIAAPESAFSSSSVGTNFDGAVTSVADVLDEFANLAANGSLAKLTNTWYNAY